jgi:hypothetical protein
VRSHRFTLIVEGPDLQTDANADALFEAGCDDGTIGSVDGVQFLEFTREANSLGEAVDSAIAQIEVAVPTASVVRAIRD